MSLSIEVFVQPHDDQHDIRRFLVHVRDARYLDVMAVFEYVAVISGHVPEVTDTAYPAAPMSLRLQSMKALEPSDLGAGPELTMARIRDVPLHTWETAARETLANASQSEGFAEVIRKPSELTKISGPPSYLTDPQMQDAAALDLLRAVYPDMVEGDTPGSRRTYQSHLRLANIAVEYMRYLMEGRIDPSAEIARQHNATPAAARSWIHRARLARLLGPAVGRTAGQGSPVLTPPGVNTAMDKGAPV